jgi:hypothetical protein
MEAGMKFAHTFSRWHTHVQMKALTPSLMKPADEREDVLFWQALQRARGPKRAPVGGPIQHSKRKTTKHENEHCYIESRRTLVRRRIHDETR